jgi:hypothetical protein
VATPRRSATERITLSANLALDKGIAQAEAGHADRGLLWMLEALKTAPQDAEGFKRMIRWNLGAWLGQVHRPLRFVDLGEVQFLWLQPGREIVCSRVERRPFGPVDCLEKEPARRYPSALASAGGPPGARQVPSACSVMASRSRGM